ncbi:MAG TPA: hypothetical protein VN259_10655 [Xanthomonadales bacterium]|nr:hypothetical protein [Xanthomonadales bacterium]
MNWHLRTLGAWLIAFGGIGLVCGLALFLLAVQSSDRSDSGAGHVIGGIFWLASIFLLIPALLIGVGLRYGGQWLRHNPFKGKSALLLMVAGVGAGFVVVIRLGFWMHDQQAPRELSDGLVAGAAALLVYLLIAAIWQFWPRKPVARPGIVLPPAAATTAPIGKTPFETANPSPRPRPLPPRPPVDPRTLASCAHLAPIEQAMRAEGIEMRVSRRLYVSANCRISQPELLDEFGADIAAIYDERHEIDRSYLDPKTAFFHCQPCRSTLMVVHPDEAGERTPWFPS